MSASQVCGRRPHTGLTSPTALSDFLLERMKASLLPTLYILVKFGLYEGGVLTVSVAHCAPLVLANVVCRHLLGRPA